MWSPALELSDCNEAAADDSKVAMLDAEADVVLEAVQLNMLSTSEEAQMGCVASGAKWFISNLYGRIPRGPLSFAVSKTKEAQEGVEGTISQLLRPEGGILTTSAGT